MFARIQAALTGAVIALAALGPQQAFANEKVVVALNTGTVSSTAMFYIARDKGYFSEAGLDVDLTLFDNATHLTAGVLSGSADLGNTGFSAGFFNTAGNGDLKVIAAGYRESPGFPGQVFVASTAAYDKGLKKPADLAGRKIGLSSFGGGLHYDLILLADKYHFPLVESNILQLQSNGNILAAMKTGAVDAGVLSSAPAIGAVKSGDAKIVAWVGDEVPYSSSSVYVSAKTLATKRAMLVKVMRVLLRTTKEYAAAFEQHDAQGKLIHGPHADEFITLLAKDVGQTPDVVEQALAFIPPDLYIDPAEVVKQVALWKKVGMVSGDFDGSKIVDLSVLREAQAAP